MSSETSVAARGPWTDDWGYARAVRIGDRIEVSGTSAIRADGEVAHPGDPYAQTVFVLDVIERALNRLGATVEDVVRTRGFLVSIDDWREVGRAHAERFGATMPASTCVAGIELMKPELLVEFEATAVIGGARAGVAP